jgi:hypothetical protein
VRGCACGAYTHPVLAAPFLPRLFLKQLPDDLCTKFPAKIRARFSDETVHHFTHLEKKDIMWDGVREQVVEGSKWWRAATYLCQLSTPLPRGGN